MRYQVVLPERPHGGLEPIARDMADVFGIPEAKAAALLRRAPGPLTKGIAEREAVRVAHKLRRIGLSVHVRPAEPGAPGRDAPVERVELMPVAAGGGHGSGSDPAASPDRRRSPFLSQVDEVAAPERPSTAAEPASDDVIGASELERPGAEVSRAAAPKRTPAGYRPDERARAAPVAGSRSPLTRSAVVTALAPGAAALLVVWAVLAWLPTTPGDDVLEAVAGSLAETVEVLLAGRDPAGVGASADLREALAGAEPSLRAAGLTMALATDLDGRVLAGWLGGGTAAEADTLAGPFGIEGLLDRSREAAGAVTADVGLGEDRRRLAVAAIRMRGEPLAAMVVGAPPPTFLGRDALAVGAGALLLALGAVAAWLASRSARREHDRVLEDIVRISRGDLGRPVEASDRYAEAVQALERIRVSLQEGLERLRRRRRQD